MPPRDDDATPRRAVSQVNAVRAAVVVACFVIATIVLLGPASHLTAAPPSTVTTTTHPLPPVHPAQVSIQVANGTGAKDLAQHYTQYLSVRGWNTLPAADTINGYHPGHTIVYFAPGFQEAAREVATQLGLLPRKVVHVRTPAASHQVANAKQVDLTVVLGHDLAG